MIGGAVPVGLDLACVKRFLAGCGSLSPGFGGAPLPASKVPVKRCGESGFPPSALWPHLCLSLFPEPPCLL